MSGSGAGPLEEDRLRGTVRRGPGRAGCRARDRDPMWRMVPEGSVRRRRPDRGPVSAHGDALRGDGAADGVERPGFRRHSGPHEGGALRRDGLDDPLRQGPGKTHPGSRSRRCRRSRRGAVVDPAEPYRNPQCRRPPGIQVPGDLRGGISVSSNGPWRPREESVLRKADLEDASKPHMTVAQVELRTPLRPVARGTGDRPASPTSTPIWRLLN